MVYGYIYKIEFPNGKHYIGQTISLEQRKREHKKCAKKDNTVLYKALRKYNIIDTFELIEIDTADTFEKLCEKEIEYILIYNSHYIIGYGYNMTYGGDGINGYIFTEEDRKKNSQRVKKYYENNPEVAKQNGERLKEYYKNHPEVIQQISERVKKYYEDNPDAGKEHSEKMKQHYENPEVRQQMSETRKEKRKYVMDYYDVNRLSIIAKYSITETRMLCKIC